MDQLTSSGINKLVDNYQKNIGIEKDERKMFELYIKDDEMGNAAGTCNVEIVIYMELELKGIYVKHLFITKNPQRWVMQLERVMLDTFIVLELELKQISIRDTCIIKKQQKWETYMHSVYVILMELE